MNNKETTDQSGRTWESFCDDSYYGLHCVRVKDDKTFNSCTSFHFDTEEEVDRFLELIKKSR